MLRWHVLVWLLVAIVAIPLNSPCCAQTATAIESARLKGVEYLKSEQYDDGSWELDGHEVGITALCALALIENGVPITDEVIEKANRFVNKGFEEEQGTDNIAMAILFLSRVGDRDSRPHIRDLAARLIAGQNVEGGWGDTCPLVNAGILSNPEERPKLQPGVGDNRYTQFAVLGLWASSHYGVDITKTMSLVSDRFIETQREDGGWPLVCEEWTKLLAEAEGKTGAGKTSEVEAEKQKEAAPVTKPKPKLKKKDEKSKEKGKRKGKDDDSSDVATSPLGGKGGLLGGSEETPTVAPEFRSTPTEYQPSNPSMTFAGLYSLAVAHAAVIQEKHNKPRIAPKAGAAAAPTAQDDSLMSDPSFVDGLKKANEFASKLSAKSSRHFLWSVERLGVALGAEKFGETDWFNQGATALLASQEKNGSWGKTSDTTEEVSLTTGVLSETSFAILFLRKAHLGSDISRLLSGEPADRFQIISQAEKPRFNTLDDALKAAKDGDRIRIEGAGPFQMSHIDVGHDLTIEAGLGYRPVFRYDVGYDADGRRSRPQENAETRHMVRVTQGTLTLEGLELQMDPPELGPGIPWAAVVVQGGTLRMLNCSISEANKQGMAAVRMTAPGQAMLQNCLLVGGRSGLEVLTTGEQQITLQNCVIFSKNAFAAKDGENADGSKCSLTLTHCALQTGEVFTCKGLTTPLDLASHGVAYQSEWMGQNMLTSATGHQGLTWTGSDNIYDIKRWIGNSEKPNAMVKDAKSWNTFWGGSDTNSVTQTIPYSVRRTVEAFNHVVKGEDFEFAATSSVHALRRKTGIDPLLVGPGEAYLRYRDSFDYRTWGSTPESSATEAK